MITVADMVRARACVPRRARDPAPGCRRRRLARGHAGARVGGPVRRPGRRRSSPSPARTRCIRRAWPGMRSRATRSPPIRTGRAATTTAPGRAPTAGHGRGAHGRPHHVSLRPVARRQVRPAAAVRRRHPLRRSRSRSSKSRATCATRPTRFVKRFDANTYLYTSRALSYFDLARQYGRRQLARRRPRRVGADAAHRVQLRLALSAVGLRGAGGRAARGRQGGRAPRDRRAVRPRLLSAGGGAPDADDSGSFSRARQRVRPRSGAARRRSWKSRAASVSRPVRFMPGSVRIPNTGARAVPIYQTTSYVFEDPESAAAYFNLQEYGNTYSRIMNPTVAVFEERMANLEGGCGARRVRQRDRGAGGGALHAAVAGRPRRVVVGAVRRDGQSAQAPAAQDVGGADVGRSRRSRRLEGGRPRRTPRPSTARRSAIPAATCSTSRRSPPSRTTHELPLLVDNTFATPFLCRPIEWGADIVLHSATKFIGGHGTSIGGVVVDSGQFNWSNGRFPVIADPSPAYHGLQFHETFGTYGYLMKLRAETLRDLGAAMSPFNAFLFLQGLETLSLRMARHVENAAAVAGYLESHALASNVTYPGLPASRYRPLVDKYLPRGAGAVFSFDCRGGRAGGPGLHPRRDAVVAPRERRRFEEPDHPSRQHDASSAQRRRAPRGGRRPGNDPALGRHRSRRRSDLGSRAGLRARGRDRRRREVASLMTPPFDLSRYQDPLTIQRVIHSARTDRGRRPVEERAARQLLRRLLPQAPRLPRHSGQPARDGDSRASRASRVSPTCPCPWTSSTSSARRTRCRGSPGRPWRSAPASLWCQFTVINEEGGADRRGGRPLGGHGPLPQGRTRPLHRADALARLQHAADYVGARRAAVDPRRLEPP